MRKLNKDIFLSHYLSQETTTGCIPKNIYKSKTRRKTIRDPGRGKGVPNGTAMEKHRKRNVENKNGSLLKGYIQEKNNLIWFILWKIILRGS